jgi:hypothetical protein
MLGSIELGVLIAGGVWVEMTFGVCPWEKGLVFPQRKNLYGGMLVQHALHEPGVWGLLLVSTKKMGGNEVAIAHE